jgi:integrase/recombinase XerD
VKAYLELHEIQLLEEAAASPRDRLLVRLLWRLGCRISEALAVRVEDVDFDQGTVTIEHLKARTKLSCPKCSGRLGKSHAFCPECGTAVQKVLAQEQQHRRVRTLPIDKETLNMLRDYIEQRDRAAKNGRCLLFAISRGQAWRVVSECARWAGLPPLVNPETGKPRGISPHRLRDAFAVHAMKQDDSGDGLRLLQEHLGHASFNTTARYRKVSGQEHRRWYDKLWNEKRAGSPTATGNAGNAVVSA